MPAPTTERRRRLDREAVVDAAERVLDLHGYDELTMTSLAAELGTRVSSLYNHVDSLEDLRSALQIRAMSELGRAVRTAAMGQTGAAGLRALCQAYRDFAKAYPARYAAMTRPPLDPEKYFAASIDAAEAVGVIVRTSGVAPEHVLPLQLAIFATIHGYVSLDTSGFFVGIDDLEPIFAQTLRAVTSMAVMQATEPIPLTSTPAVLTDRASI